MMTEFSNFVVAVRRDELLKILRTNKARHVAAYDKAREVFRKQAIEKMQENLAEAIDGGKVRLGIKLERPRSYEDEYDQAISMLELSTDDTIELTMAMHEAWVLDRWAWKDRWNKTVTEYNQALEY